MVYVSVFICYFENREGFVLWLCLELCIIFIDGIWVCFVDSVYNFLGRV